MKSTSLLIWLFVTMIRVSCEAQTGTGQSADTIRVQMKNLPTAYGPATSVRTVLQDRQGNMWLATNEGIFRYDGKTFTNISANLTADRFFSVIQDRKGNFWFGTYGSGAYYYDGTAFVHFTSRQGLANNQVSTLFEDKTGSIWFGVNGAVSHYDGKSFQTFTIDGGDVNAIAEDKTGRLWFGSRGSTYTYDGHTFSIFTHKNGTFGEIWSIIGDQDGTIWLGGANGLWRYDGTTVSQLLQTPVLRVFKDQKQNVWISSACAPGMFALTRYDAASFPETKPSGIVIGRFRNLFGITEARDGSIWFGTNEGVYRCVGNNTTGFGQ